MYFYTAAKQQRLQYYSPEPASLQLSCKIDNRPDHADNSIVKCTVFM